MKQDVNANILEAYQSNVTRLMCKIMCVIYFAIPVIWAATAAGFFDAVKIPLMMVVGFVVCYLPSLLLKLKVSENIIKYIAVISLSLLINFLVVCNVKIQMTYLLMPVVATMYFDKNFILQMSVVNLICITGSTIRMNPINATKFEQAGLINSADIFLVERLTSYTLEIIVMTIILVSVATFVKRLMEKLAETEEVKRKIDIAEASNKAKSAFLATMSHEIRTPMNAILGVTQIELQKGNLPNEYSAALNRINDSGYTLLHIINDILDLSKIESGKLEINPVKYDTPSLINDSVQLNMTRLGSKDIKFSLRVSEDLPAYLIGDDLRIKQILNNLLSNAFKYTDKGQVTLEFKSQQAEGDTVRLIIVVRDTGQGMDAEQLSRLFTEYSRFNMEANRAVEGTGLGLSITKKLVELMQGNIAAESEPGEGTVFTVQILQQAAEGGVIGKELADKLQNFSFSVDSQVQKIHFSREYMPYGKVLVVDDVDMNLHVAKGLLSPYGMKIETVTSGFKAIDKVKSGNVYDIIFMDHMMPDMDGIETVKRLRDAGYTHPIVALTANAVVGQAEVFAENNFDGFMSKPIDLRHLDAVLNTFIRDRHPEETGKHSQVILDSSPASGGESEVRRDCLAPLRSIDGMDVDSALEAMGGMAEVYEGTVRLTARLLPESIEKLDVCMAKRDINEFMINVHGIKSVLKNIGASALGSDAALLEKAAAANELEHCEEHYPPFRDALGKLIEGLNAALETGAPKTTASAADKTAFLTALAEAKTAAEVFDSNMALQALTPHTNFEYGGEIDKSLQEVIHALEEFDCENALTNIIKLEETLV